MAKISFSIPKQEEIKQFFASEAGIYWISPFSEARHVFKMFLNFQKFEPQRSYKHDSYKKSVYWFLIKIF